MSVSKTYLEEKSVDLIYGHGARYLTRVRLVLVRRPNWWCLLVSCSVNVKRCQTRVVSESDDEFRFHSKNHRT